MPENSMPENSAITLEGLPRKVLIYQIQSGMEDQMETFGKNQVTEFLKRIGACQADFWTVKIAPNLVLLICPIDNWDTEWFGKDGIADVQRHLVQDGAKVLAHVFKFRSSAPKCSETVPPGVTST